MFSWSLVFRRNSKVDEMTESVPVLVHRLCTKRLATTPESDRSSPIWVAVQLRFLRAVPIQVEVSNAPFTSDAGLLPLRPFDDRIGLTA